MYPRNAASPEPIAIGAVVQISDGAVQTSGCTVRIKPIGVSEGDGAGTTSYSTDGIVYYTPTQGETDYTSFILIAKKTGCIPVAVTVVTSASATAGKVVLSGETHTSAVIPTVTSVTNEVTADVAKINSSAAAAIRLALSAGVIIPGTVDTGTNAFAPTTTQFDADDITEATSDHYNGRVIVWTSGALLGQATSISDYAAVGGIGRFTVVALTEAPANNDTFIIV